jgi:peptide subunit release factor 1 (eRF1)
MVTWMFGEKCVRCGNERTKKQFEGLPTCESCEQKLEAEREDKRRSPLDGAEMIKEVILNVILDSYPTCHGVWLDKGELDLVKEAAEEDGGSGFTTGLVVGMVIG